MFVQDEMVEIYNEGMKLGKDKEQLKNEMLSALERNIDKDFMDIDNAGLRNKNRKLKGTVLKRALKLWKIALKKTKSDIKEEEFGLYMYDWYNKKVKDILKSESLVNNDHVSRFEKIEIENDKKERNGNIMHMEVFEKFLLVISGGSKDVGKLTTEDKKGLLEAFSEYLWGLNLETDEIRKWLPGGILQFYYSVAVTQGLLCYQKGFRSELILHFRQFLEREIDKAGIPVKNRFFEKE